MTFLNVNGLVLPPYLQHRVFAKSHVWLVASVYGQGEVLQPVKLQAQLGWRINRDTNEKPDFADSRLP